MSKNMKRYLILFAVYWFLVFSPFLFDWLNQIEPRLLGMPFTFWSIHLLIAAGSFLVYWGSTHAWDSYDDNNHAEEEEK